MRLSSSARKRMVLLAAMFASPSFGQISQNEPTPQEIAHAYRSKAGEFTPIPGIRWERWRIKEVRGWSLRFKRVCERRGLAILTREYRVSAKKNGSCAEYQITDTMPLPPFNVPVKPAVIVEPGGLIACP